MDDATAGVRGVCTAERPDMDAVMHPGAVTDGPRWSDECGYLIDYRCPWCGSRWTERM